MKEQLANEKRNVFSIFDILGDMSKFQEFEGKEVAVIGGGAVGLDVVEYYAERGAKKVSIVEMQGELGKDLDLITKLAMMEIVEEYGVEVHVETKLTEVKENSFLVEKDGELLEIPFDLGFVCLGMRAEAPLIRELDQYAREDEAVLLNIGDSKVARRIMEGTRDARDILKTIEVLENTRTQKQLFEQSKMLQKATQTI